MICERFYPFGMGMPGRTWSIGSAEEYRFGFNGKENDDAIKGDDNSLDFGGRIYDNRICRWLSIDSKAKDYPAYSPYNFALDNPVINIDVDGKKVYFFPGAGYDDNAEKQKAFTRTFISLMSQLLPDNFEVIEEAHEDRNVGQNVAWAVSNSSMPIKNINKNDVLRNSVDAISNDFKDAVPGEPLNIVGSSYGSVVAAQTALYIAQNKDKLGISKETQISVTLISSPVNQDSKLYEELTKAGVKIIYKEVQDPNDNVTGLGGTNPIEAWQNALNIALEEDPSILSSQHTHNQRADDPTKAYNAVQTMLSTYQLEPAVNSSEVQNQIVLDETKSQNNTLIEE